MRILSISSYLPIPKYGDYNSIVLEFYDEFKKHYADTHVTYIRPVIYIPWILKFFSKKWNNYYHIRKLKRIEQHGCQVYIFPYFSIRRFNFFNRIFSNSLFYCNYKKIFKIIDEFDLVHAQNLYPDGLLAYKLYNRFNIPYIITIRRPEELGNTIIIDKFSFKILNNAAQLITLNVRTFDLLKKNGFNQLHLLPHGIPERFIQPKVLINKDIIEIVTVASLIKLKNIDLVIKALALLKGKLKFQYTIIGDGVEKEHLLNLISSLNLDDFIKINSKISYEQMHLIYKQFDIFVLISQPESFGRVYLEAMAAGLPVIVAQNSGVHLLINDNSEGFSIDINNIHELAEKILCLAINKEEYKRMSLNAFNFAQNFLWVKVVDRYYNVYKTALNL